MWGNNDFFQLGLGNNTSFKKEPTIINASKDSPFFVDLSCNRSQKHCHSGAIDKDGLTYTWGSGY